LGVPDAPSLSELPVSSSSLPALTPPPRFGTTSFVSYRPQHPSQERALARSEQLVNDLTPEGGFRWFWQRPAVGEGHYLDGGFGVGKTHLLASAYGAFGGAKAYLSFAELVHLIGVLGMDEAAARLGVYRLFCIDEFELDDPGNTLIVKSFLTRIFEKGGSVMTTSNTPPEAQGQGRFNAQDFKREIQSLADHFEVIAIEGPDYRKRDHLLRLLSEAELSELLRLEPVKNKVWSGWEELFKLLQSHHPIRYRALLEQIGVLYLSGASAIATQNDALRFVHFIDKLYDLEVGLRMSGGVALEELFAPSYRDSAYAKKHYRCLSRISELLEEAPALEVAPG
jgi:cell division protein ZapE